MLGKDAHGKGDSLAINVEKKTFQCFSCKKRGSIIDFVKAYRDVNIVGAAGEIIKIMKTANMAVSSGVAEPRQTQAIASDSVVSYLNNATETLVNDKVYLYN